jgi:hypothetical protein
LSRPADGSTDRCDEPFAAQSEVAGLKNVWVAVDPLLPFKIDTVNGREGEEADFA